MSPYRSEYRPAGLQPGLLAVPCPRVADLIDFAQGRISPEERLRVEAHLQGTGCPQCRSWISKATSLPADPFDPPPLRSNSQQFSAADNTKWQQQAFQDLAKRLQQLEE